jgi:hypothetical protein
LLDLPAEMNRGSSTGCDEVYVFEKGSLDLEPDIVRVPVFAQDFGYYVFSPRNQREVIFPYDIDKRTAEIYPETVLKRRFPKAFAYLSANRAKLRGRKQHGEWYGFSAPRNFLKHEKAQILVPLLVINRRLL